MSPRSEFDAVLFDLDGTLIEFAFSYADFMRSIAESVGVTDPHHPFFKFYSANILREGAVTFRSAIADALRQSEIRVPSNFEEKCESAVNSYALGIKLLPGTTQLIETFHGVPKAIVSNGPSDMQRAAIEAVKLAPYFDQILVSGDEDVAVRKPNPAIFKLACSRLGTNPERTLMIGDNHEADIEGARSAGLLAQHISDFQGI